MMKSASQLKQFFIFFFTFKQSIAKNTLFKCVYNLHEEIFCLIVDYYFFKYDL